MAEILIKFFFASNPFLQSSNGDFRSEIIVFPQDKLFLDLMIFQSETYWVKAGPADGASIPYNL